MQSDCKVRPCSLRKLLFLPYSRFREKNNEVIDQTAVTGYFLPIGK